MRAFITLKEGKTYRYKGYVFTKNRSEVTDPGDIAHLKNIGVLKVLMDADKPAPKVPKKGSKPADDDGGEGEGDYEGDGDEGNGAPGNGQDDGDKKPAAKPKGNKPGPKPKPPKK